MYSYDEVYSSTLEYFNGDELATNVFFKYVLKDKEGNFHELNPDNMHRRLAREFARIEEKFGGDGQLSEDDIYKYLRGFAKIVPQGSPMANIGNNYVLGSVSNCNVVAPPSDTMSSIFSVARDMANLYKRRFGCGTDLSNLRPEGASVNNAANTSSGAWSFADLYSYITRKIGQSGRRGALMLTMDIKHPDIDKFIVMKQDLTQVTGANISVKMRDDFMEAVKNDEEYTLQWPIDGDPIISRDVRARDIWDLLVGSATKSAEPGIIFWDTIIKNLPAECYADVGFKHYSTNPCGEVPLGEDTCRLISQNLKSFVKNPFSDEAYFDMDEWKKCVAIGMRLSDDLVEIEIEKMDKLIEKADEEDERNLFKRLRASCINGRRTGLGTHGLADALARLCISYDSDSGLNMVDMIYRTLRDEAYRASINLAKERGPFPVFDWNKEKNNAFIKRLPAETQNLMAKIGRRNISMLTNAPTGSVSILSQTSSGLEPVFKNVYTRRKKINHDDSTSSADFIDSIGDMWNEFTVYHKNVEDYYRITGKNSGDALPDYFVESGNINCDKRVELQSIMSSMIDHSISSTLNLPRGTDADVIGKLYMMAWEKGCKGLTVYVDGSRSGVLISKEDKKQEFNYIEAPDRPDELECDIHAASIKGEKWIILVGLMDGRPYEVFGGLSENIEIPSKYKKGTIIKVTNSKNRANRYDLRLNGLKIKNIIKMFDNTTYQVHTRMVSLGLRHGAKPSFLVEQLQKDPDNDLTSFSKVLARVLKKYIENGTRVTGGGDKVCPECSTDNLVYQEGCVTCTNCGWSRCA